MNIYTNIYVYIYIYIYVPGVNKGRIMVPRTHSWKFSKLTTHKVKWLVVVQLGKWFTFPTPLFFCWTWYRCYTESILGLRVRSGFACFVGGRMCLYLLSMCARVFVCIYICVCTCDGCQEFRYECVWAGTCERKSDTLYICV